MIRTFFSLCIIAASVAASAQNYPSSSISLIIPLAAGDATDLAARTVAEELSRELKTPVVPVNRPGAGGALGTDIAVKAAKDGYTLVLTNNAALVFRSVMDPKSASYDPFKDLTPLALGMRSPSILAVGGEQPFRSWREMVDYAKKNPGKVRIGTAGVGSVGDFCVQTINSLTGAGLVMVPFQGAAPAVTAMRGGHIEGVVLALGTMTAHLKSGAVRGIVISDKWADFPDIPTMRELGYAENLFGIWAAFFAPAGLPPEVTARLVPAFERAIRTPEVGAKLKPLGILTDYASPEALLAEMRDEHRRVTEIAKKAGLVK